MQNLEKEVQGLKLKNKFLEKEIMWERSVHKRVLNIVSILLGVTVFALIDGGIMNKISFAILGSVVITILYFVFEFIGKRILGRYINKP